MMKKRMKQGGALVIATALVVSAFVLPKSYAATAIDTAAECSVQINVPSEGFSELKNLEVPVNFYKVANVNVVGKYKAVAGFEAIKDVENVNSGTKTVEWEAFAAKAKEVVDAQIEAKTPIAVAATGVVQNGTLVVEDLEVGLYLVDAQVASSDAYKYEFNPYLVSLPNNYYYQGYGDNWVYDLTGEKKSIGLKPEKSDRYGDLVIRKNLDAYNETIGGATFVFQVEAVKTDVDTGNAKVVYSDVVSMTFKAPGTDSITIKDIPAGAVVTVTEVYSGASYQLTSDGTQKVIIVADDETSEEDEPVSVTFANTYDGRSNGGNGVVNSFIYNEENRSWTHSATEDSTP